MDHISLEISLAKRIKKRRIIEAVASAVFLIIAIAFMIAHERSKVVNEIDVLLGTYTSVTYNENLTFGIDFGWVGFIYAVIFYIADLIHSKFETVEVCGDYITLYRGMFRVNLYVNGELQDGLSFGHHLEVSLSDGSKVFASIGKSTAHLSFSNGHSSIDL